MALQSPHEPDLKRMFGEDVYKCEALRDHLGNGRNRKYLVKWVGYEESENTWEPEKNIIDKGLIQAYEENLRTRPTPAKTPAPAKQAKPKPARKSSTLGRHSKTSESAKKKLKADNDAAVDQLIDPTDSAAVTDEELAVVVDDVKLAKEQSASISSETVSSTTATATAIHVKEDEVSSSSSIPDEKDEEMQAKEEVGLDLSQHSQAKPALIPLPGEQPSGLVVDEVVEPIKEEEHKEPETQQPSSQVAEPLTNGSESGPPLLPAVIKEISASLLAGSGTPAPTRAICMAGTPVDQNCNGFPPPSVAPAIHTSPPRVVIAGQNSQQVRLTSVIVPPSPSRSGFSTKITGEARPSTPLQEEASSGRGTASWTSPFKLADTKEGKPNEPDKEEFTQIPAEEGKPSVTFREHIRFPGHGAV